MTMQVDKARLDEMLLGLEGVTPGPWKLYEVGSRPYLCPATVDGGSLLTITREDDVEFAAIDEDADALHFLRCDPDTIRSIITELLELRSLRSTEGNEGKVVATMHKSATETLFSKGTHPAPPLAEAAWQFTLHPMDTAPSGDDALEPSEIEVHEGSWAVLVGTNAKPIGWIDTHETFKGRTYRDRILPAPPLEIEFITLQTVPQGKAGQHLTVSVRTADGREAEVIRSWGGLPDISIYHTVTESGIAAALTSNQEGNDEA